MSRIVKVNGRIVHSEQVREVNIGDDKIMVDNEDLVDKNIKKKNKVSN